jgi:allantoin racemase
MRLLYVLVDDLEPTQEEMARLTGAGQRAVGEGSTFCVESIPFGPRHYYESAVGLALCVPGILQLLLQRQSAYDAALLGCFGDPGLRAVRAVATIPVIGAAEAATSLVRLVAQRYGIVTIEASDIPEIEVYLSSLEGRAQCVGVDAIGLPFYALVRDPADTLSRLRLAGERLIAQGAQAILLGCMSFGFYPFAAALQQEIGVPVIDPLRAGISAARALLALDVMPSPRFIPRLDDLGPLTDYLSSLDDLSTAQATSVMDRAGRA